MSRTADYLFLYVPSSAVTRNNVKTRGIRAQKGAGRLGKDQRPKLNVTLGLVCTKNILERKRAGAPDIVNVKL